MLSLRAAAASPFQARERYVFGDVALTGAALEAMRQDWLLLVLKRKLTSRAFCRKHHIDKAALHAIKRAHPQEFSWRERRPNVTFPPPVVAAARGLIERYHDEQMQYVELKQSLRDLGINDTQHAALEKQLPKGMRIGRRTASVFQQRRRERFDAIADAMEALIAKHQWVIGGQTHLLQVLSADADFKQRFPPQTQSGEYTLSWLLKLGRQDLAHGGGRIATIANQVKPAGKRGRPQPSGVKGVREPTNASEPSEGPRSLRHQLLRLAEELASQEPSEAALKKTIARVERELGIERPYRLWRLEMEKRKGVIPELQRWRVGSKNDFSLRYLAQWVACTHAAGPAASEADVAKLFKQTAEYLADPRIPNSKVFSQIKQNASLGWDMAVVTRARFQLLRNLLEAIRTGPEGANLKEILQSTPLAPQFPDYDTALYYLRSALDAGEWAKGQDERVLRALRARSSRVICGFGEAPTPTFDPNREPPWSPLAMAEKVLSIPRVEDSELFAHAIGRLKGRLPFENNHVMIVYHRYSDVAALVDLFVRAGMSPKNSVFVSTPYPFDPAFDVQLSEMHVPQINFPVYDEKAFVESVAKGLQRLIDQFDERKRKHGHGRPILALDDGGCVAHLLQTRFQAHAHKIKVLEVTAAGHRIGAALKAQHGRLPFVYYSVAYSVLKRLVTSEFYANRVVDRLRTFSDATGVQPINSRVTIIGGGPMGRFSAQRYQELGFEVTIVEPKAEVRAELIDAGFSSSQVVSDEELPRALEGRGVVLSVCGFLDVLGPQHLPHLADGVILAQGASKRNDFAMEAFEAAAQSKEEIARSDGIPQKSFTYGLEDKRLHFVGDGWTINHDGSLHGSPFEDVQLETVLLFESAVEAAHDSVASAGDIKVVGQDVQEEYLKLWTARRDRTRASRGKTRG